MRLDIVGAGRAGMAVAMRAKQSGHEILAVVGRDYPQAEAQRVGATAYTLGDDLPEADLTIVAVVDDAIEIVAEMLAFDRHPAVVHLSGLKSVSALEPLASEGNAVGSFHPLQTLPDADTGARRLSGAWVAVTTVNEDLRQELYVFARSMGMHPFDLSDDVKGIYHAAAASAANFPTVSLAMAADLFERAGVPFEAARPLVQAVVANSFELGPVSALTGPVVRGDVATVNAQLLAVDGTPWASVFRDFVRATAAVAGRSEAFERVLEGDG